MLYVTAVHTFVAEHGDELEFEAGDRIEVLEKDDAFGDGWWRGRNTKGEEGLFPATYISESPSPISNAGAGDAGLTNLASSVSPISTNKGADAASDTYRPPSPRAGSIRSSHSDVAPDEPIPAPNGFSTSTGSGDAAGGTGGVGDGVLATAAAGLGAAALGVGAVLSKTVDGLENAIEGLTTDDSTSTGVNRSVSGPGAGVGGIGGINANENADIHRPPSPTSGMYGTSAIPPAGIAGSAPEHGQKSLPAAAVPGPDRMESYDSGLTASEDDHFHPQTTADGGHGIDTSARARLAAQAKIANDREMARANNRISTGVSGLVYSDESDGEDDDDDHRTSYKPPYGHLGNGHPSQPTDSFGTALQPALTPNTPPLVTAPSGGQHSQPNSTSHTPRSGSLHAGSAPYAPTHNAAASAWSVDEVVEWAKSKGFDESIWSKFQEHEITGDLLLELDANLLKELDIPAFGKRLRIAQAIGELKRPSSGQGQGSPASGRGASQPPSSFVMPGSMGMAGTHSAPGSAFGLGPGQAYGTGGSGRASTPPSLTPPLSGGPADGYSAWAHPPVNPSNGSGTHSSSHSRKTSSISGSISGTNPGGMTAIRESERANVISTSVPPSPHTPATSGSISGPIVAPAPGAGFNGNGNGNGSNSTSNSARNSTSGTGTLVKRNSAGSTSASMSKSASLGHKRGKSSLDVGKERLSFFGRNRKPAPAAPEGMSTSPSSAQTLGSGSLGRSGSMAGKGFAGFGGNKGHVHQMQPASPHQRSPSSATHASSAVGGAGALKQIGTPDHAGWMKKKGDRYGWKNRYFVLKGAHLYYLKSEHEDKVKGHIPLAGYRVIVDENTNPGSYGFRLVPSSPSASGTPTSPSANNANSAQTHAFSSAEQSVIRNWMKALMKATIARDYAVPVTSSCNIPTIPLAEAQALQPRPPSPTTRERTQRATRRENTSSLTPHDASVLTSLTGGPGSNRISLTPSRPDRDVRRPSAQFSARASSIGPDASPSAKSTTLSAAPLAPAPSNTSGPGSITSTPTSNIDHTSLLTFVNSTLPSQYPRATSFPGSFVSGEVIFLLVRSVSGIEPNPPVPPSAFAKDPDGKPGVDGLFAMMDMLLDAGIDPAGVSLNEVREGNREAIGKLVQSVKGWCEGR